MGIKTKSDSTYTDITKGMEFLLKNLSEIPSSMI
jgi:hypothetical protein